MQRKQESYVNRLIPSLAVSLAAVLSVAGFVAVDAARTVAPVLAQAAPPAGGQHGQRFGQMLMTLDLSDAQKSQIRGIIASARQQNENVTDPQVKRANMRAAYAKVRAVLTAPQQAKLKSEMEAARAQRESADHS
jgi:Spy/CpxP family protein refolding chaperone